MADINKTINIDVTVDNGQLQKTEQNITKITKSTENHTSALKSNRKGVLENGGAMGLLGAATGGLAMDFKDAIEAIEMTGVSLKGLRGALIATGIGALAILLLELVTNWDKWIGVIDGSTAAMEKLDAEIKKVNISRADITLAFEREIGLAEAQGATEAELTKMRDANSKKVLKSYDDEIEKVNEKIQVEIKAFNTDEENLQKLEDEREKLRNDRYTAETQQGINLAKEETRKRDEKLTAEKTLNEKLIAFSKNRTQNSIKDLENLLKNFNTINDSVNSLNTGKYGEVYEKLKTVFDLYKSSQQNIIDTENKITEIEKQKGLVSNKEQRELDLKLKKLKDELVLKKEGFDNIVNPNLKSEIESIQKATELSTERVFTDIENAEILNNRKKEDLDISASINELDMNELKTKEDFLNKEELINKLYDLRYNTIKELGKIKEDDANKELGKNAELQEGLINQIDIIKNLQDYWTEPQTLPYSEEDLKKTQDVLNNLFGYKVDLDNLTIEQQQKVDNYLFELQDKKLSVDIEGVNILKGLRETEAENEIELYKVTGDKKVELAKNNKDELDTIDAARLQYKQDMLDAEMNLAENAVGFLKQIAGENKGLQRAAIIAESALGIGRIVINTQTANAEALALYPNPIISGPIIAMNTISAGLGIATNIAATAKALSAVGGGSAPSVGGAGASPGKASFNVVGSSNDNQLAASIASQQKQPVKAYVVGSDITTQQSLDRNIRNNATFL